MKAIQILLIAILLASCAANPESVKSETTETTAVETSESTESTTSTDHEISMLAIENLLRDSLGLAPDIEIIIDYLEIPAETELAAHYHPGEEFVYMLEGSGELTLNREEVIIAKKGDLVKVPLKAIHSYKTLEDGTKAVAFRIHEKGQPDRIMVDEDGNPI